MPRVFFLSHDISWERFTETENRLESAAAGEDSDGEHLLHGYVEVFFSGGECLGVTHSKHHWTPCFKTASFSYMNFTGISKLRGNGMTYFSFSSWDSACQTILFKRLLKKI